jgi:amino acid adenylation domain-containing protein
VKSADAIPSGNAGTPREKPASSDAGWREKLQSRRVGRAIPQLADRHAPPLSFAQEKLWLLDQLEPGNPVYNRPLALRLKGLLDESALRQALQTIVDRHEVLRTRFKVCDGQPEQVISSSLALDIPVIELSEQVSTQRESRARRLATEEALRPFDLAQDAVLRATLLRLSKQEHVLLLVFHHIAFDAWSARVFVDEFANIYRALTTGTLPALAEPPIQYADFAHWQRQRLNGELFECQLLYWKQQLSGCVPSDLPTDRPRPNVQSHRGGCIEMFLPETLADSLQALSRRENATLFMVLLAAFQVLLSRYTGCADIAVGSALAGRNWVETEKLIGIFINILVLRTDLSGDLTFRELLKRVRETCRGAYSNQDMPFEKLVEKLRPESGLSSMTPFQVMFNLENLPQDAPEIPGLRVEEFEFEIPVAACDLTLEIIQRGRQLRCSFVYNADLFDRGTVERMAGHYRILLEAVGGEPDGRIASFPLLTSAEQHQILVEWNRTEVEYPREATIQELFEAQAARTPEAMALTFKEQSLTYGDLNRRANRLAHHLRGAGVGLESKVGICAERSLEMVVGLLAILKAGGACVPLDPAYPKERLAFMLEDAGIQVLLTQERLMQTLPRHDLMVACLDKLDVSESRFDSHNPVIDVKADNLAYVMYTSGSTGKPKGVEVLHRGIVRLLFGTDFARFGETEVFLQLSSICFDATTLEIWGALLHGGRCVLFPSRIPELQQLRALLKREKVTTLLLAPSLFNTVIDAAPEVLSPVRRLFVAGETLSVPHICRALSLLPNTELVNGYGPTESATFTCCYRIPRTQGPKVSSIPIGRPIANTRVYILDQHLQPVPLGVAGELCIGGDGLARGYLNRPELTCEKFIPNPFSTKPGARLYKTGDLCRYLPDGNIEFLGRLDNQVKIRGFRVEMGEIESALAEHPAVSAAAVVVREEAPGDRRLVAYTVPHRSTSPPTLKALRDFLREKLPDYMMPSDFVTLESLPLTPNGKVDRRALPTGSWSHEVENRYVSPRDGLESELVRIWEEILNVRPIGIEHDFFDLGGHSLLAVRMMSRLEDAYGKGLPLATLFAEATIKHLAERLRAESRKEAQSALIPVQPGGSLRPFYFLHGDWAGGFYCRKLARLLGREQPLYVLAPNGFDGGPLLPTVEAMAKENVRYLVALQPEGPYLLGGFCSGGLVAYEMARQMEQQGLEVGIVILLDTAVLRHFGWLKALIHAFGLLARFNADAQIRVYMQLRGYFVRVQGAYQQGLWTLWAFCLRAARDKLLRLLGTPLQKLGLPVPVFDGAEQYLRFQQFGGILMNYRPRPYRGRVVLLRPKSMRTVYPMDRTSGWGKLASQLEVHDLPADHDTCRTEHIGVVAEHIKRCLHDFRAEAKGVWAQRG